MDHQYAVYATRFDDPHIIEQIPARGLSFSMPLSGHGDCSFSATVRPRGLPVTTTTASTIIPRTIPYTIGPGGTVTVQPPGSVWRAAITPPVSGVLIVRDGQPVWDGWVTAERQDGPRSFSFTAKEWGSFFTRTPAVPHAYAQENDHVIFRDVLARAQAVQGQNVAIQLGATYGASRSDLTIPAWDTRMVDDVIHELGNAAGGPEWYYGSTGTVDNPQRVLVLADPPSSPVQDVLATLEYVYGGNGQAGGNVLAATRSRDIGKAATASIAVGAGIEAAQMRATASSARLLGGWPRLTRTENYGDNVKVQATLQRHADADLAAVAGVTTGYQLTTLDEDPDWTQVPRGSAVQVVLDTDVYGQEQPVFLTTRVLDVRVSVPDDGQAQVQWSVADVLVV